MRLREGWWQTNQINGQILLLAGFEVLVYFGISAAVFWVSALIGAVVPAMILFAANLDPHPIWWQHSDHAIPISY